MQTNLKNLTDQTIRNYPAHLTNMSDEGKSNDPISPHLAVLDNNLRFIRQTRDPKFSRSNVKTTTNVSALDKSFNFDKGIKKEITQMHGELKMPLFSLRETPKLVDQSVRFDQPLKLPRERLDNQNRQSVQMYRQSMGTRSK